MAGNVAFAPGILGQYDAARPGPTHVAVASLEFSRSGQPDHILALWWVMPIHDAQPGRMSDELDARGAVAGRNQESGRAREHLLGSERDLEVFEVRLPVRVGIDP